MHRSSLSWEEDQTIGTIVKHTTIVAADGKCKKSLIKYALCKRSGKAFPKFFVLSNNEADMFTSQLY